MVGPTAQISSLICTLNARIRRLPGVPSFSSNSTSQFCAEIRFTRVARSLFFRKETVHVFANSPDQWLDLVVSNGAKRAFLTYQPTNDPRISDRMSAGFVGGGGGWNMLVQGRKGSDCWRAHWSVGNREALDRRIWQVQYALVAENQPPLANGRLASTVIEDLGAALNGIESFAREQAIDGFANAFQLAQKCLASDDPLSLVYHRDIAPRGAIGLSAARLLAAAQAAWVFGGMGSWNDLGFEGDIQKHYEQCSDRLFDLLNESICVGVNESGNPLA